MLNYNVLDTNEYYVRGCLFKSYEYASHLYFYELEKCFYWRRFGSNLSLERV